MCKCYVTYTSKLLFIVHHTCITSVTPNTHGISGICASTGRIPSNIPPSTTVLCHSLFFTHSLHVSLESTQSSTFFSEFLCTPLQSHSSLCISSCNRSLPSVQHAQTISTLLSGSCSRHIQYPNGSRAHRHASYPLKTRKYYYYSDAITKA